MCCVHATHVLWIAVVVSCSCTTRTVDRHDPNVYLETLTHRHRNRVRSGAPIGDRVTVTARQSALRQGVAIVTCRVPSAVRSFEVVIRTFAV